jgi:hypothetical protein
MTSNKKSEKQLPTVQELGALITERVEAADRLLTAGIKLPEGHVWWISDDRLSFWAGCPVHSTEGMGVSIYVNPRSVPGMSSDALWSDPAAIKAEIRIFLPKAEYRDGKKVCVYRKHADVRFAAHLWVSTGPHWAFQSTTHLVDNEPFVYADTLEALCAEIVVRMNTALTRAIQWVAQRSVKTVEAACA